MSLTPELAAQIRQRREEFLADPDCNPDIRAAVAKFDALPLVLSFGGTWAIRPDGEIVSYGWDAPHDLRVESNPRFCRTTIFQGSLRYPELKSLVPPKPTDAKACDHCQGTGVPPEAVKLGIEGVLVCKCGGLGWLLPGE